MLLGADGFDGYGTSGDLIRLYYDATAGAQIELTSGTTGGPALRLDGTGGQTLTKNVRPAGLTVPITFRLSLHWTGTQSSGRLVDMRNRTTGQLVQLGMVSGKPTLYGWGGTGNLLLQVDSAINDGGYHRIEMFVSTTSDTVGTVELRVDDQVKTFTGDISTVSPTSYVIDQFLFVAGQFGAITFFDDWIAWDDEVNDGTDYTGQKGVHNIARLNADGDGNSTQWVRNAGANDWEAVDEVGADDQGATYLAGSVINDESLVTMCNLSISGTVEAVAVNVVAANDINGIREMTLKARSGVTTVAVETPHDVSSTAYKNFQRFLYDDPDTAVKLTETTVNALEVGVEITD